MPRTRKSRELPPKRYTFSTTVPVSVFVEHVTEGGASHWVVKSVVVFDSDVDDDLKHVTVSETHSGAPVAVAEVPDPALSAFRYDEWPAWEFA